MTQINCSPPGSNICSLRQPQQSLEELICSPAGALSPTPSPLLSLVKLV